MAEILVGIGLLGLGGAIYASIRRGARLQAFINSLAPVDSLYVSRTWALAPYQVLKPGGKDRWRSGVLIVTHKRLALYDPFAKEGDAPLFHAQPDEIQGFWRPVKYRDDEYNELWVHTQIGLSWIILKVKLQKNEMLKLIRAMKAITTEEQVKAYRRRPYIHRDPTVAYPAKQTLQGEWELYNAVKLYLMPLALVVLQDDAVKDVLPLAEMQQIAALRRMEGGEPAGLIRFEIGEARYAFALSNYEAWANDLAEAAKRTLEEPVQRKRKSKSDDEEEDE